jgi:hypothetical protein
MNNEETSSKDKNEDKKQELATLPAETSIEDSTKEKKVVVVKPGDPDVKISDKSELSEEVKREDDNIGQ